MISTPGMHAARLFVIMYRKLGDTGRRRDCKVLARTCDHTLRLGYDHVLRFGSCCHCGLRVCAGWFCREKAHVQKWCAWDSRRVQGLDATAARTFFSLRSGLERLGVELVLTHMPSTRYTYCICMLILPPPILAL